jgi:hypothetical protein
VHNAHGQVSAEGEPEPLATHAKRYPAFCDAPPHQTSLGGHLEVVLLKSRIGLLEGAQVVLLVSSGLAGGSRTSQIPNDPNVDYTKPEGHVRTVK